MFTSKIRSKYNKIIKCFEIIAMYGYLKKPYTPLLD